MVQINNFTGFETQGNEESSGVTATPLYNTSIPRSGAACIDLSATENYSFPWVADGVTDAGTDYIFGFGFRTDSTAFSNATIVSVFDDSGGLIFEVRAASTEVIFLRDANGTQIGLVDFTISPDTWYYVEVYAQLNNASANWEWFVDGTSIESGSAADLTDGNAFGTATSDLVFDDVGNASTFFDDVYILSGASAATDRFGGGTINEMPEVFMYQNDRNEGDGTADLSAISGGGLTLNSGEWTDAANTPGSEASSADFTGTPLDGVAYTDGGARAGPSGDANIDGDSNIKAWKGIWHAERGGGGATTHTIYIGNDADTEGNFDNGTIALLNNEEANFELLGETDPPLSTENFAQGFGVSGNQDFRCREMWATLLHVPSAADSDVDAGILIGGEQQPIIKPGGMVPY